MVTRKRAIDLELVGGDLALDFANTVEGSRDGEFGPETLTDYGELVAWAAYAGVIDEPLAARLAHADQGDAVLARAHALRAAVFTVFRALATGERPPPGALAVLAAEHAAAAVHARIEPAGAGLDFAWDGEPPDRLLWPLAQAAVDLLRSGPLDRVKLCDECSWLFVDASRNRSRRWCSMNECGGRLKMRRYRARRATAGR